MSKQRMRNRQRRRGYVAPGLAYTAILSTGKVIRVSRKDNKPSDGGLTHRCSDCGKTIHCAFLRPEEGVFLKKIVCRCGNLMEIAWEAHRVKT